MRRKKGQAAIEFLTTYSWAILIIFLSIGALMYFDIFNTSRFISERCETGAQIKCIEAELTEGGIFRIRLANNFPVDIRVNSIRVGPLGGTQITTNYISDGDRKIEISEVKTFTASAGSGFSSSTREQLEITISFSRDEDGANDYEVKGNIVVRPLS